MMVSAARVVIYYLVIEVNIILTLAHNFTTLNYRDLILDIHLTSYTLA